LIQAIVFDLDGTLVKSEELKGLSYAIAVQRLRGLAEPVARAIEAYKDVVGAARQEASRHVIAKLNLEPDLAGKLSAGDAREPWHLLTEMRTSIYEGMVADPQVIRDNQWPHTVALLRSAREAYCYTALATMSQHREAAHVLKALDLVNSLDLVLAREDVLNPKPDPEIYLLAAERLGVSPSECLALEDSANGVRAAIAAGTNVVALATPFTSVGLHEADIIADCFIVHSPEELLDVVKHRTEEHNRTARGAGA
jgi:beta-phosphoglucomutase